MALINTLRNKMGKVVVALVSLAILSFILADLMGPNSTLFGDDNNVGEIAGQTISLKDFQAEVQQRENSYILNTGSVATEKEKPSLRQQAWDFLITRYAFGEQYDELGVRVTGDELWDMMQGKNISPGIKQSFTNPETGEFDRAQFMQFLQQLPSLPGDAQVRWELFKKELKPSRERLKYENLMLLSTYVTSAEAQREYNMQTDQAEVKYLYIPYYAVNDSLVSVTDSELSGYLEKNKEKYKVEETRSMKYISFPVVASAQDSAYVREEMTDLLEEFKTVSDDSVFADVNTDGLNFFGKYHIGNLPQQLQQEIEGLSIGDVKGPYLDGANYKLYKVTDIFEDTIANAKASHILIKGEDDEAEAEAKRILREIRSGASFEDMARQYGTDGTASKGGDLGWFEDGRMVAEFNDAVFDATRTGLINQPVKTQFGYHIIRVDELKTNTAYKIATIEREILPGDETQNAAFRKADEFAAKVDDLDSFDAQAETDTLTIVPANDLAKNAARIGFLGEARQIVRWLFKDASKGNVSEVFELDDQYVVGVMTKETEEGYQSVNSVKGELTAKVRNEKKGEIIINKLSGMSGSLDDIAASYGDDAKVYTSSDLKISSNSLPSVGFDPKAVGRAFSLEAGQKTEPFASENGVLIVETITKTIAPEIADYATYKTQLEQNRKNQTSYNIGEAVKEFADIKDDRFKFY
ncbi:foldase [Fulvivirga sp. M361]|uniref:peptidylprolyl isomerase n=1 Tax=Fulvivirga sp. M361 TaxID=2594266 RepID=UPI00117AC7ED|nr:SurA N-terminal domain-containing protein [Fulvivirga sp. M361]TRX61329.1 foldase [Fulvivirga sp. M361]